MLRNRVVGFAVLSHQINQRHEFTDGVGRYVGVTIRTTNAPGFMVSCA
jgi:hypothetical protein